MIYLANHTVHGKWWLHSLLVKSAKSFPYITGYVHWFTVGILQISSVDNTGSKDRKPSRNPFYIQSYWVPVGDRRLDQASLFKYDSLLFHKEFVNEALQRKLLLEEVETANIFPSLCNFYFPPNWLQLMYSISNLTWFLLAMIDQCVCDWVRP